jgi:hypothetical protein
MDQRIKNILPEVTHEYEGYEVFGENITYIFNVPDKFYELTYELDDFVIDSDIEVNYRSKLRYCDKTDKVHIASKCNMTGTPRGLIVNVDQKNALKLEKQLIIFSLLKDTKWTVTKIDNIQLESEAKVRQDELINSLFTFV